MKNITLLGCGSAFTTPEYWQTNFLLKSDSGKNFLIDCGSDIRHSLAEQNLKALDINAVYISHDHADHAGGLEWLGFSRLNLDPIDIYTSKEYEYLLSNHVNNTMVRSVENTNHKVFFNFKPVTHFDWEEYSFKLIKNLHISLTMPYRSYGLMIKNKKTNKKIYLSTDTVEIRHNYIEESDLVFHDCETGNYVSHCHTRIEDLEKLPSLMKLKIIPVHYNINPKQSPESFAYGKFPSKGNSYEF